MAKKTGVRAKTIIGWREWCSLNDLGLPPIAAKIDTGARTSSLHAYKLTFFQKDGQDWVAFRVHPVRKRKVPELLCQAKVIEMRKVISSNGHAQNRPVIETNLTLGHHNFTTQITLTNRDDMGYRMLIGRQTLLRRFIVDSGISWALGGPGEFD